MKDKVCLITGANSGIGKVMALELAKQGAHIIMLCRNEEKAERAREEIVAACGHEQVDVVLADLASVKQIREAAEHIKQNYPKIDVLNNNAGLLMGGERELTEDGFEMTLGVNHLAPFLLTHLLLDRIDASGRGNIINVSSEAHRFAKLSFKNLQYERGDYAGWKAYCRSKLCNVLFTRELSRRLEGTCTVTNALHPGGVATNFGKGVSGVGGVLMRMVRPFMISEEKGAETSIYLATSGEGYTVSGKYFNDKKIVNPSKAAQSDYYAKRLWEASEELLDISFEGKVPNPK